MQGGFWVIGLTLIASLLPALGAAGHTIISYKQEQARSVGRPWWQRAYLDLLLLVPAYYGYRQLQERGTISLLGRGPAGGDPFTNPLLILAPADGGPIRAAALPNDVSEDAPSVLRWEKGGEIMQLPLRDAREVFEREYLLAQVTRFGGNISRTATFVGMERSALHRKLKSLGLHGGAGEDRDGGGSASANANANDA